MEWTELDDAAIEALRERIAKATVFVVDGSQRQMPDSVGSGTLLLTPGGKLVVLTAKHLFETGARAESGCRICWYRCTDTLEPFPPARIEHPSADVALVLVPPEFEGPMRQLALPTTDVEGWFGRHAFDDNVFLSGYPAQFLNVTINDVAKRGTVGFTAIAYTANVKDLGRDPLGRLTLEWKEMVFGRDPTIHELPKPTGMSGGALWYFNPARLSDPVWEPSKFLRVVGVQSAWIPDDRVALIEGSDRWIEWFETAIETIDAS